MAALALAFAAKAPEKAPACHAAPTWLALQFCTRCAGRGLLDKGICGCVYRAIFRACLMKYHGEPEPSENATRFARHAEYRADFELIARRTLGAALIPILERHYLRGLDWTRSRGALNRGNFFHAAYFIERQLGRAFYENTPYSVWPVDAYFGRLRHVFQVDRAVKAQFETCPPVRKQINIAAARTRSLETRRAA